MPQDRNYGVRTDRQGRLGTFRPGNPGRSRGARNRPTVAALALLEGEAEALALKAVELALGGDATALKLVLDRMLPRERCVPPNLPQRTLADLDWATETFRVALARGHITPSELGVLTTLVETSRPYAAY